jgi:hypothetical protein
VIRAILYTIDSGEPVKFLSGSLAQLNANAKAGRTWRERPDGVDDITSAPPLASLPAHPELVEAG